jgi:nucleoside-diphosphate-sugar epimerase
MRTASPPRAGVVLRFGWFYGPGARHSEQILSLARRHIGVVLGPPDGYLSSIHVGDGGAAVAAALHVPAGTFNVVDDGSNLDDMKHHSGQPTKPSANRCLDSRNTAVRGVRRAIVHSPQLEDCVVAKLTTAKGTHHESSRTSAVTPRSQEPSQRGNGAFGRIWHLSQKLESILSP